MEEFLKGESAELRGSPAVNEDLTRLIAASRPLLRGTVAPDPGICAVARTSPAHHAFLANSVQAVYQRQSNFLAAVLTKYFRRATNGIRVLDWGAGKGQNAYLLRQRGFEVVACDVRGDVEFGADCPLLEGIKHIPLDDPVKLPFEDSSFDVVTSFGVLEHVPRDLESMREIWRILRPGGIFYITFLPYPLSWTQAITRLRVSYQWRDYHDHFYSRKTLHRLAGESRFSVASLWFAQLFPKNSVPRSLDPVLEPLDRALCRTPLRYFATNLEAVLVKQAG